MLAYEEAGRGPAAVLLHAFPLSGEMWRPQIQALARHARLVLPDLPGFGRSPRQKTPSVPAMAQAVAELLDQLGIREPVFIGGLSMGGYAAFEFARQFPERVRGLGLFSTRAAADTEEAKVKRMKTSALIQEAGLESLIQAMIPNLLGITTRKTHPETEVWVREMILRNEAGGVTDALKAMAERRDSSPLLSSMRVPVMVAAGDEDLFIPWEESETMQRAIPGSVLTRLQGAGHLVNLESPEAFNEALGFFLKRLEV